MRLFEGLTCHDLLNLLAIDIIVLVEIDSDASDLVLVLLEQ